MTNASDRRVKASLERTRLALKAESLDLEKRRREYGAEREQAIVALRILCERWGSSDWSDQEQLSVILEDHLGAPLLERLGLLVRRLRTLERQIEGYQHQFTQREPAPATLPAPAPPPTIARPHLVEPRVHRVMTIRGQDHRIGQVGYRASCVCTWQSALVEHDITATQLGGRHVAEARAVDTPRGVATHG